MTLVMETKPSPLQCPDTQVEDEISLFVGHAADYYRRRFVVLDAATRYALSFNRSAALLGPIWWSARQIWVPFWTFLTLETIAVVQICRGLFSELGAEQLARAARLMESAESRRAEASQALSAGQANANSIAESAAALDSAARQALEQAEAMAQTGPYLVGLGLLLLLVLKLAQGLYANWALYHRFHRWQADKSLASGIDPWLTAGMAAFTAATYGLTAYRFTARDVPPWLAVFPADRNVLRGAESAINDAFQWMTESWAALFIGIARIVRLLLDGMEVLLVGTPWPVVMAAIILIALKVSGTRFAIFTAAALAYLGLFGFWEKSMATVALLGSAALLCLLIGIPLGIVCARKERIRAVVWPILDLMQTMPSFVYLIPVIAFFGIGKPPGILATIVFGMPPVVRLTVLGLHGVPASVREAANAFGVSKMYMLLRVDLPLAKPSIMAGVNQTILMCLSMVVIASLIGAKGLGEEVLDALTYANEGKGILAGLAILFCAIVLDRIVQARATPNDKQKA